MANSHNAEISAREQIILYLIKKHRSLLSPYNVKYDIYCAESKASMLVKLLYQKWTGIFSSTC